MRDEQHKPATQPLIHRLASCVHAPSVTLSDADGNVSGEGAQGFYLGERRLLSRWSLSANGRSLEVLTSDVVSPASLVTTAVVRDGTEASPDPRLLLERTRKQRATGFTDTIELRNLGLEAHIAQIRIDAACDVAATSSVKSGRTDGVLVQAASRDGGIRFAVDGFEVDILPSGGADIDVARAALSWTVALDPGEVRQIVVEIVAREPDDGRFRPVEPVDVPRSGLLVTSTDPRIDRFVSWSTAELRHLLLADSEHVADAFVAAGSPWFFTLFGRDSLWAARMTLPFGTRLAESTLQVLARHQGATTDALTAEAPGRILHELRSVGFHSADVSLPDNYYGSIDATPLWMSTLVDSWRWGAPTEVVAELLPALQSAAGWLLDGSDPDGDGLCEYLPDPGAGLSNQGWKDSGDSINWQHGPLAEAPLALSEVQGYAYEAALGSAELLEQFDRPGSEALRSFAARLRDAFHASFWIEDDRGPYVAIGLDGAKQSITGVSSNPGHLLGTGLLDAGQERIVADRLIDDLSCAGGLRTLSHESVRYNPLSYHNGSVWPHDTAVCARGMMLAGLTEHAATLLRGVLHATDVFGPRLPELYCVLDDGRIVAYPAACRPQAWAAASAGVLAWALAPVLPDGVGLKPLRAVGLGGRVEVNGLRLGGRSFRARVDGPGESLVVDESTIDESNVDESNWGQSHRFGISE